MLLCTADILCSVKARTKNQGFLVRLCKKRADFGFDFILQSIFFWALWKKMVIFTFFYGNSLAFLQLNIFNWAWQQSWVLLQERKLHFVPSKIGFLKDHLIVWICFCIPLTAQKNKKNVTKPTNKVGEQQYAVQCLHCETVRQFKFAEFYDLWLVTVLCTIAFIKIWASNLIWSIVFAL